MKRWIMLSNDGYLFAIFHKISGTEEMDFINVIEKNYVKRALIINNHEF